MDSQNYFVNISPDEPNGFTSIADKVLHDPNLSNAEKGMLAVLINTRHIWHGRATCLVDLVNFLNKYSSDDKRTIKQILKQLQEKSYFTNL